VLGAVNSPGAVAMPPEKEFSLLDIIARCGGFSRLANRTKISVTRTLPDGQPASYTVNADLLTAGSATDTLSIQDGDVIMVPERML
jgi:polysaccharide export outer membrane protein